MAKCRNCGSHVTERYIRVQCADEDEDPPACPQCPYKRMEGGRAINTRSYAGAGEVSQ